MRRLALVLALLPMLAHAQVAIVCTYDRSMVQTCTAAMPMPDALALRRQQDGAWIVTDHDAGWRDAQTAGPDFSRLERLYGGGP